MFGMLVIPLRGVSICFIMIQALLDTQGFLCLFHGRRHGHHAALLF